MPDNDETRLLALRPALRRRALRLTRNAFDADDLVQETLMRLLEREKGAGDIQTLRPYAMRVLAHAHYRRQKQPDFDMLEDDQAQIEPDAMLRIECAQTLAAIEKLPQTHQTLMAYVVAGETSPARIAELTGLPLGTVMSRLARARRKLRVRLARDGAG